MSRIDPRVFRTYDIRALVPELVDEESAYYGLLDSPDSFQAPITVDGVERIGQAIGAFISTDTVVVGYDARISSPAWAKALASGITSVGKNVIDIGLSTTDMVYYASGKLNLPAVEITASHCTRELNGMKIVMEGARVVGKGSGMERLSELALGDTIDTTAAPGTVTRRDIQTEYIDHLMQFIDPAKVSPMRIIADAGNGAGGPCARDLFARMPQLNVSEMYFDPDGRFPNHEANPFERENIELLIHRVADENADFGVAWDGDADRVFFVDETGEPVPGDFITTLIARYFLKRNPGATIVYDLRASRAVPSWVERLGGKPVAERVGHSFIKQTMRRENAVFGGEVSGHYYFRDHYYADNGYIPLLAVLDMLSSEAVPLSKLVAGLGTYYVTGEINSSVADTGAVLERLRAKYADAKIDERDGISIDYPTWHFNVRPSANDPLVRLNLEAESQLEMERLRDEVLGVIREGGMIGRSGDRVTT